MTLERADRFFLWYGACASVLCLAYVLIFMASSQTGLLQSFVTALANILPLAILGLLVRPILRRLAGRSMRAVIIGVLGLSIAWSLAWYATVAMTIGLASTLFGNKFELVWLSGPALQWQAFQGLVIFALICLGHFSIDMSARIEQLRTQVAKAEQLEKPETVAPTTMMVRTPDGLQALSTDDIIVIEADDDDSIIKTRTSQFKARTSLASWCQQLDAGRFVRIHRARLINLQRLISAEPLGEGRLMVHLEGGYSVETSRSGAQLLKKLIA
jgi:two-component system, LytTR family, response regulator